MYRFALHFTLLIFLFLSSCGGSEESTEDNTADLNEALDSLNDEMMGPIWKAQSDGELFEIEIPRQMKVMDELNPTATLEYGYFERFEEEIKENYIIVIPHLKTELEEETPGFEYNVENYSDLSIKTLMEGKDWYEVKNEATTESINALNTRVHEIEANINTSDTSFVEVFYMLGVFESEKAYYQVLSWTLLEQKDDFYADMDHMIRSFKEL